MANPFPSHSGSEQGAALHSRPEMRDASGRPSGARSGLRLAPLVAASILLIAVGAALVWLVGGAVAGLSSDTVGAAAMVLGGVALAALLVTSRRSHRPA
jgi:hypothetical protein